jgi:uncharacterized protein YerC
MKQQATCINQKLLDIIQKDFEGCEWFIIAANELMRTLNDTIVMFKDVNTPFEAIKDSIGKIGVGIGKVERCLDGVEDCYNRTVELLSKEMQKKK